VEIVVSDAQVRPLAAIKSSALPRPDQRVGSCAHAVVVGELRCKFEGQGQVLMRQERHLYVYVYVYVCMCIYIYIYMRVCV
jgi:hypothetical protein